MCELTNQSRLGIHGGGLKEKGAKIEIFRQRGKACKPILVVENEHNKSPLRISLEFMGHL